MMVPTKPRMNRAGFTLIELMIAMLITGIVSVVIYALFDQTSDNFLEVDQLADADDRLRFSMDRLRSDIQMAGAQMTPDSGVDPWVMPDPGNVRFAGIIPYNGWQDDTSMYAAGVADANPHTSMDGLVVMGAYDFPLAFELSGLVEDNGAQQAAIVAHYRGLFRLFSADPFRDGLAANQEIEDFGDIAWMQPQWTTRLLRVTDRQGFQQFMHPAQPLAAGDFRTPGGGAWNYQIIQLPGVNDPFGPKFKGMLGGAEQHYGLDNTPEGDLGYDAALIDAFWYHVVQDPQDANNLQLVRDRLCARDVALNFFSLDPETVLAGPANCAGSTAERVVISNYVADFQVWFDCADVQGNIVGNTWTTNWETPNGGVCMASGAPAPGFARVAHVRLSVHTPTERKSQRHIQFEDATGALCDPENPNACNGVNVGNAMLRTFDSHPRTPGAARVATMQADFELSNFAARNAVGR